MLKIMRLDERGAVAEVVDVPPSYRDRPSSPDDFFPGAGFVIHEPGAEVGMVRKGKGWAHPPPPAPAPGALLAAIKAEAGRRILARFPAHAQSNALALGLNASMDHGPDPAGWPAELQAELARQRALWDWTKAVRARSNELEAELPADPADDRHWPPAP
ncbi:MAG: hypothetical protein HEQ16_04980 [Bosea sp.]|jgi:hypothetical protein|nr:hypothetical protein [Bosea sp. (in: a-proteobacteria)]